MKFIIGFAALFVLVVSAGRLLAQTPIDGEFLINTTTTGAQQDCDVAADQFGNFVVVWSSDAAGNRDIIARVYDGSGTPKGAEIQVVASPENEQHPAVAMFPDGSFVVAWEVDLVSFDAILMRRYTGSGIPVGSAQQVEGRSDSDEWYPALGVAPDGDFVVVMDAGSEIYVQRYDDTDVAIGLPFQANVYDFDTQTMPDVAVRADKSFIISWTSMGQDGDQNGVFCRRFDWSGAGGSERQVNVYTTGDQNYSAIGVQSDGGYLVSWTSDGQDGSFDGILAQRFSNTDVKLGTEFLVNTFTPDDQSRPGVAVNILDEFTITWYSYGQDGSGPGVFAQDFTASGIPDGLEYAVNTTITGTQISPQIAVGGPNQIIVWHGDGTDPDGFGVQGQRYTAPGQTDLVISSLVSPADITDAAVAFPCTVTVHNNGIAAGGFHVSLKISLDDVISMEDTALDSFTVSGLAFGADTTAVFMVILPTGSPRGDVFVGAIADNLDEVEEVNESNNTAFNALGFQVPAIYSLEDVDGDQGGNLYLKWYASPLDVAPAGTIGEYTVWRAIDIYSASRLLESGAITMDEYLARNKSGAAATSSPENTREVLRSEGAGPEMIFWEMVGTQPAYFKPGYAMAVPTLFDSTSVNSDYHYVQVIAHLASAQYPFYVAALDSARSTDDLAPGVPQNLAAAYQAGGVAFDWDDAPETDFALYRIYRASDPAFVHGAGNLVNETAISQWNDSTTNPWGFYYKVTVVDHAGNEGPAAAPGAVTGVPDAPPPGRFALHRPVPNPFNPSTKLSFEMAAAGHARLKVYDTAGRLVATLVDGHHDVGSHHVIWDGRDSAGRMSSAGVYLYRLEAGGYAETKQMTLVK